MLKKELLQDESSSEFSEDYRSCLNARGLYDSMQFVLRLRPDIHFLLDKVEDGISTSSDYDFDTIQAFSTYFHETVHWWQHVGSISGFMLSLSYPSQTHINHKELVEFLELTGPVKSIAKYNQENAKEYSPNDDQFKNINIILNNFNDIQFFKLRVIVPETVRQFSSDPLFESIGHSFHISYSAFVNIISASVDRNFEFLPNIERWEQEYRRLNESEFGQFYYGSPIAIPVVGLKDIFEGQARFVQIQYLYFASDGNLTWDDFESLGMLSGVYYKAFSVFLKLTGLERPNSIDDPVVALYLLVLDISMNPTEGFPFDIHHFESLIESVDPGIRFMHLCQAIADKYPELKFSIVDYSAAEYYSVSEKLSKALNCPSPIQAAELIDEWSNTKDSLKALMKEEATFCFDKENLPIRLMLARFIKYQKDKLLHPQFFCWPGYHLTGTRITSEIVTLFNEHEALFKDKADGDIYPRIFPNKDEKAVQETFDIFYSWVATYDLCRQWITEDGEFSYDFWWLTSKYSMAELEDWASSQFKFAFGAKPQDFQVV